MKLLAGGKHYVDRIAVERANYEQLINRIKNTQMTICGAVGRWSVKDTIAYIQLCELYLADRINHIFCNQNLEKYLSEGQLVSLFFDYDHPEFGAPFGSNYIALNWKILKYNSTPLEDLVGLENMAYLGFISLLQLNEQRLLERVQFSKILLANILDLFNYHTTTIENWLAVH